MLFSRAYLIAKILPSTPRSPKPPGTRIPLQPANTSERSTSSFSNVSELTHLIFTSVEFAIPACEVLLLQKYKHLEVLHIYQQRQF